MGGGVELAAQGSSRGWFGGFWPGLAELLKGEGQVLATFRTSLPDSRLVTFHEADRLECFINDTMCTFAKGFRSRLAHSLH